MKRLARIAQRLGLPVTREWLKRVRDADRGAYVALRALLRHFRMKYGADEPVRSLLQLDARSLRLQLVWPQGRLLVLEQGVRQTPVRRDESKLYSTEKRHERRLFELLRTRSQEAEPSTLACAMLVTAGPYAHYATDPALRLVCLRRATADPALNTVVANRTLQALRELFQQARKLLETGKEKKRQRSASLSSDSSSRSDADDSDPESESEEESEEESDASSSSVTLGSADSSDDSSFSFNEAQLAELTSSSSESGEPTPSSSSSSSEEPSGNVTTSDSDGDDQDGLEGEPEAEPDPDLEAEAEGEEVSTQY